MSPFVIGTSINREALILENYFFYFSDLTITQNILLNMLTFGKIFRDFGEWLLFESIYYFINHFFTSVFSAVALLDFYKQTIQIGIILIFIGIFLNFKKFHDLNDKKNNLINFIKFTLILTFLLFEFFRFILFFGIPIYYNTIELFFTEYRLRFYELFSGCWAIIFVLTFDYFYLMIKNKYLKLKNTQIPSKRISKLSKISLISLITFTSGFFYLANFGNISHEVYVKKDPLQAVLFIGNYFEQNPLEERSGVLLEDFNSNYFYGLIVDEKLEKKYYNFTNTLNYTKFISDFYLLNCEFVFLNISIVNDNFKTNFSIDFETIHEWSEGYRFSKVKELQMNIYEHLSYGSNDVQHKLLRFFLLKFPKNTCF